MIRPVGFDSGPILWPSLGAGPAAARDRRRFMSERAAFGDRELICLPLRVADGDGAPARAVLRKAEDAHAR